MLVCVSCCFCREHKRDFWGSTVQDHISTMSVLQPLEDSHGKKSSGARRPDTLPPCATIPQVMVTDYNSTKATQYLWHESVAEPPNNLTLIVDVDGNTIHDGGGVEVQVRAAAPPPVERRPGHGCTHAVEENITFNMFLYIFFIYFLGYHRCLCGVAERAAGLQLHSLMCIWQHSGERMVGQCCVTRHLFMVFVSQGLSVRRL